MNSYDMRAIIGVTKSMENNLFPSIWDDQVDQKDLSREDFSDAKHQKQQSRGAFRWQALRDKFWKHKTSLGKNM